MKKPDYESCCVVPLHIRQLLQLAKERGFSSSQLLGGFPFTEEELADPHFLVSYRQTFRFIRRALNLLGSQGTGLVVGLAQDLTAWGVAGMGLISSRDYQEAIDFGINNQVWLGSVVDISYAMEDGQIILQTAHRFEEPGLEHYLAEEFAASVVKMAQYLNLGDPFLSWIQFPYPEPSYAHGYQDVFKCPIYFGKQSLRMCMALDLIADPLPTADQEKFAQAASILETLQQVLPKNNDIVDAVHRMVSRYLDDPDMGIAMVASKLNMSERTLRRRLTDNGVKFKQILEIERQRVSEALLTESVCSIGEVARRSGYSSSSSFRRAYKKWSTS